MVALHDERRQSIRRPLRHPARIVSPGGSIPCTVVDVSQTGAGMEVAAEYSVPDTFILRLADSGRPRRICRLVWRTERRAGVRFELGTGAHEALAALRADQTRTLTDIEAMSVGEG